MSTAGGTAPPALHLTANLDIEVGGAVHELRGDGQVLRLTSPDPRGLLAALPAAGRGDLADLANGLGELGLTIELARPDGRVTARFGSGVDAPSGRVLAGTSAVEVDALRLAGPALRARAGATQPRTRRLLIAAAAGLAALVGWLIAR